MVIDYLGPDHLSIYAHDNDVTIEINGFNFREDDHDGNSLQARIDEQILPEQVEFIDENFLKIKARNMPTEGAQSVYLSNNHGISWQRSSSFIALKYHIPPQVSFVDIDKLEIPTTPTDYEIIQMDIQLVGEFFPPPSDDESDTTTFYCVWGSNTTLPFY